MLKQSSLNWEELTNKLSLLKTKQNTQTSVSKVSLRTLINRLNKTLDCQSKEEKRKRNWEVKARNPEAVKILGENFILNHPMSKTSMENRPNLFVRRSTKRTASFCQWKDKKPSKKTEKLKFSKPSTMEKRSKRNILHLTKRAKNNNKKLSKRWIKTSQDKTKMHDFDLSLLYVDSSSWDNWFFFDSLKFFEKS